MKKWMIPCLVAWLGVCSLQAQTVKLPTKKAAKTVETKVKEKKESAKQETPAKQEATVKQQTPQSGTITLPTVKKAEGSETAMPEVPVVTTQPQTTSGIIPLMPVVKRKTEPRAKPIVKRPKPEDNEIYESAEQMPTYPGGVAELMKFIEENMQYPEAALNDSVDDVTIIQVSFIVEKDGSPKDFEVIDEHHPALEAEAVRILEQMPKWKPATQNGVKVRVEYVVPVKFKKSNQTNNQ